MQHNYYAKYNNVKIMIRVYIQNLLCSIGLDLACQQIRKALINLITI